MSSETETETETETGTGTGTGTTLGTEYLCAGTVPRYFVAGRGNMWLIQYSSGPCNLPDWAITARANHGAGKAPQCLGCVQEPTPKGQCFFCTVRT